MTGYAELKAARPIRHFIALVVYRSLWWPAVGAAVPFVLLGSFVEWLEWTAFPAIAALFRPLWASYHKAALAVGNAVLGHHPEESER